MNSAPKATLFLMIAGSVLALAALTMVLAWLTPKLNGAFEALGAVAYVGYFAVAIWGSVEIFGGWICKDLDLSLGKNLEAQCLQGPSPTGRARTTCPVCTVRPRLSTRPSSASSASGW